MRHVVHCWALRMGNRAFAVFLERAGSESSDVHAALRVTFCFVNRLIWRVGALSFRCPTPVPFGSRVHAGGKKPFFASCLSPSPKSNEECGFEFCSPSVSVVNHANQSGRSRGEGLWAV